MSFVLIKRLIYEIQVYNSMLVYQISLLQRVDQCLHTKHNKPTLDHYKIYYRKKRGHGELKKGY